MVIPRTGCPLSAVIQVTITQTLADGTHIQTNFKALVYRDSLGRIRYETYAPADTTPNMIEISDPVEGFSYFILPQKDAVAYRHKLGPPRMQQSAQDQHTPAAEPKIARETLGVQQFEGVLATGTKTTRTTPAGAEGNDRALTTVRETWSSPRYRHYASGENFRSPKRRLRKANDESRTDGTGSNSVSGASRLHDPGSISVLRLPRVASPV